MSCCKDLISDVLSLDKKIRFAGVYHNHSESLEDELREDIQSYFDEEETIESVQRAKLRMLSRKPVEKHLGRIQYAMAKYDKVIRYTFSLNDHDLLLVSTESDANSDLVISKILHFLKH